MCLFSNCEDCQDYCEYDDYEVNLSNCEWCSLANSYVDNEYCKNIGCENCRYYIDS